VQITSRDCGAVTTTGKSSPAVPACPGRSSKYLPSVNFSIRESNIFFFLNEAEALPILLIKKKLESFSYKGAFN
jgi:hypothetical protein